jgi:hypothetical protein
MSGNPYESPRSPNRLQKPFLTISRVVSVALTAAAGGLFGYLFSDEMARQTFGNNPTADQLSASADVTIVAGIVSCAVFAILVEYAIWKGTSLP